MASRALEIPLTISKRLLRQTIAIVDLGSPSQSISPQQSTSSNADLSQKDGETTESEPPIRKSQPCAIVDNALRKLDGLTLLEWCVRRLSESEMIDEIIITGPQQYREKIRCTGLCDARWIPSAFRTPGERSLEIAERFQAQWIVFASPLCPFTDPTLLDRLIATGWSTPEADVVEYLATNPSNQGRSSLGLVQEMCSIQTLERLRDRGALQECTAVPNIWRKHPDLFLTKYLPLPFELDATDAKFYVESIEDWDRATRVLEATGSDFCWRRLVEIADRLD